MHRQMPDVTIHMLGDLAAEMEGVDVLPRGRKARAMLGLLAVAPGLRLPRERLADLLWSDRGEEQARNSLRQALSELRMGPLCSAGVTAIRRDDVGLSELRVSTDVANILEACEQADLPRLARCLASVNGVFMAGYDGLSPGFDDWLRIERPRHHERIVTAVVEQEGALLSGARHGDVQTILRAMDHLDPYNEVVVRLGLQADHAAGDGASLHRRYRRLVDQLDSEFNIRPAEETRLLFHALTAVATDLPVPPTPHHEKPASVAVAERSPPMVMVSPIIATDHDPVTAEIAAAATDDIRIALARHSDIRVIALDTLDVERVDSICSGAVASYMLSGRLRQTSDGARINLQLGNIGSSIVVWSEQLRIDHAPLGEAVDRIVAKAVGAVMPAIDRDLAGHLRLPQPMHPDIVALYAKGRHLIRVVRTIDAVREGIGLLEQVIVDEPGHVGARLVLAQIFNTDLWQQVAGHAVAEYRAKALALLQEAAAIEPENTRIQVKLAWCYLRRREWAAAERRLRSALIASPYDADAIDECALAFLQLGNVDLASHLMQRAFLLHPFPPADYHADYAVLLSMRGDATASEEHFEASGETRLQYVAARLANLARLDGLEQRRHALRDDFVARFAAVWQPTRSHRLEDMLEWFDQTYVFRMPEHHAFWRDGFTAGLA